MAGVLKNTDMNCARKILSCVVAFHLAFVPIAPVFAQGLGLEDVENNNTPTRDTITLPDDINQQIVTNVRQDVTDNVNTMLTSDIGAALTTQIGDDVQSTVSVDVQGILSVRNDVTDTVTSSLQSALSGQVGTQIAQELGSTITNSVLSTIQQEAGLNLSVGQITQISDTLEARIGSALQGEIGGILSDQIGGSVGGAVNGLLGSIGTGNALQLGGQISNIVSNGLMDTLTGQGGDVISGIIGDVLGEGADDILGSIDLGSVMSSISSGMNISGIVDGVLGNSNIASGLLDNFNLSGVTDFLGDAFSNGLDSIADSVLDNLGPVGDFLSGLFGSGGGPDFSNLFGRDRGNDNPTDVADLSTPPAQSLIATPGCDANIYNIHVNRAVLEASRETVMNQFFFTKPDSVLEYTCFGDVILASANATALLFTEGQSWAPKTIPTTGGSVSVNFRLDPGSFQNALELYVLDYTGLYLENNFWHSYLGGTGPDIGASNPCQVMRGVWQAAKCKNFDINWFYTFDEMVSNDPRIHPPSQECTNVGFDTAMIERSMEANKPTAGFPEATLFHMDYLIDAADCTLSTPVFTGVTAHVTFAEGDTSVIKEFPDGFCIAPGCSYQMPDDLGGVGTCMR